MVDLSGFDAENDGFTADIGLIPAGRYLAVITDSELKPTRTASGQCLEFTFRVVNGPYANRLLRLQLHLWSPVERTRMVSEAELSAVCRAVGVVQPRDSRELHDVPLFITVARERREDMGEVVNTIRSYAKRESIKIGGS